MSVKSNLTIALSLFALGMAPAAFAQGPVGTPATAIHSTWGSGQGALYYDVNGKLHNGMTDPNAAVAIQVAQRRHDRVERGTDAFAQAPRAPRAGGIYNSVGRSMLSPSSSNYEPDLRSH